MKNLVRSLALIVSAAGAQSTLAEPQTFMSFDFASGEVENGFENWFYSDKGENPCDVYYGTSQSKLCNTNGSKLYVYYNGYNNDHMGWMRYGFVDASNDFAVTNSSLKLQLTGGVYKASTGEILDAGTVAKSKVDLLSQSNQVAVSESTPKKLPGDMSIYIKPGSDGEKFPEFQGKNRFSVWVLMPPRSVNMDEYNFTNSKRPSQRFSWYPFINTSKGSHYYHHSSNIPMGGWTKVQFDANPSHHNSGARNRYSSFTVGGYEYAGSAVDYFNNVATFALRAKFTQYQPLNTSYYLDNFETYYTDFENDETITTLGVGYDPESKLFDISFEDKYRCLDCTARYEVKYSFSPINNENYHLAQTPKEAINFKRSDSNSQGIIVKPNPGYNEIWAALELQDEDKARLTDGQKIYFAVKDISNRSHLSPDPRDFELVDVPNFGPTQRVDLVKTIEYQIIPVKYPVELITTELNEMVVGQYYEQQLDTFGGVKPYRYQGRLPAGLSMSQDGLISGIPQRKEQSVATIEVVDSEGTRTSQNLTAEVFIPADFDVPFCSVVVDFKGPETNKSALDERFSNIYKDVYSGFVENGATITVGSNKDYDFVAIEGNGYNLIPGDQVRLTYRNNSTKTYKFAPRLSFEKLGRFQYNDRDLWLTSSLIEIKPGEQATSIYTVDNEVAATFLTVNVNASNNQALVLDKVEFVESTNTSNDICSRTFEGNYEKTYAIADFYQSNVLSTTDLPGLQTVITDHYTDFTGNGTATVVGSNGAYNHQGVSGTGHQFNVGDKVSIYWENTGNRDIAFAPILSFKDKGRIDGVDDIYLEEVFLSAGETYVHIYTIDENTSSNWNVVNVSNRAQVGRELVLDKITLTTAAKVFGFVSQPLPEGLVEQPYSADFATSGGVGMVNYIISGLPEGLYFDETGRVEGIPQDFGDFELFVEAYDEVTGYASMTVMLHIENKTNYQVQQCKVLANFDNDTGALWVDEAYSLNNDIYTGLLDNGYANVIGDNKDYNFVSLKPTNGATLPQTAKLLRVKWYNNSDKELQLSPRVSLESDGRVSPSDVSWLPMSSVTVRPYSYMVSEFVIPQDRLDIATIINVNSNLKNHKVIALSSIELQDSTFDETEICSL